MATKKLRSIYQVKVTLNGIKPLIWRRLLVPSTISLSNFHIMLQVAMGWNNSHLHQFVANGKIYRAMPNALFDLEVEDENKVKLNQLLKNEKDSIIYEYDFGSDWEHNIALEKKMPLKENIDLPTCIKGRRSSPPDNCGGISGYEKFLKAIRDPKHPEHDEMLEWVDVDFDPEYININDINTTLKVAIQQ